MRIDAWIRRRHDRHKDYEHDVIIRLSGKVEKRRKHLSKEKYGTSHIVFLEEAKFVFEDGWEDV